MHPSIRWSGVFLLLALGLPAQAQQEDATGCKDHPLLNRLPSHYISTCENIEFDSQDFPMGALDEDRHAKAVTTVEGPKTIIDYNLQDGAKANSGLQAMRNFQNAIKAAGGTVVAEFGATNSDTSLNDPVWGVADHATTLKLDRNGKEIWILVLPQGDNDGRYTLRISERAAMQQAIVANELLDKINKDGFIALYLNFDTGKASIKADSLPQLDQVAQALKSAPELKLEVAGHTDNVGKADANRLLSQQRAQSVVKALTDRGVAAARLSAAGYGADKPLADNRSEAGRASNRRVELVRK